MAEVQKIAKKQAARRRRSMFRQTRRRTSLDAMYFGA